MISAWCFRVTLFGTLSDLFRGLSGLLLGYQRVTWKKLVEFFFVWGWMLLKVESNHAKLPERYDRYSAIQILNSYIWYGYDSYTYIRIYVLAHTLTWRCWHWMVETPPLFPVDVPCPPAGKNRKAYTTTIGASEEWCGSTAAGHVKLWPFETSVVSSVIGM